MNGNEHTEARDEEPAHKDDRFEALYVESFTHHVDSADKERQRDYEAEDVHAPILPTLGTAVEDARMLHRLGHFSPQMTPCHNSLLPPILGLAVPPN